MQRLENYFFCLAELGGRIICLTHEKDNTLRSTDGYDYTVVAVGQLYEQEGVVDGTVFVTSVIKESTEHSLKTFYDQNYELGNKHPYYIAFEQGMSENIHISENLDLYLS